MATEKSKTRLAADITDKLRALDKEQKNAIDTTREEAIAKALEKVNETFKKRRAKLTAGLDKETLSLVRANLEFYAAQTKIPGSEPEEKAPIDETPDTE